MARDRFLRHRFRNARSPTAAQRRRRRTMSYHDEDPNDGDLVELAKSTPFKLTRSLDTLPDDADRNNDHDDENQPAKISAVSQLPRSSYAIKRVREGIDHSLRMDAIRCLCTETLFLAALSHPNIVRVYGCVVDHEKCHARDTSSVPAAPGNCLDNIMLIMDRFDNTLEDQVERWKKQSRGWKERIMFPSQQSSAGSMHVRMLAAYGTARALEFLHQHK